MVRARRVWLSGACGSLTSGATIDMKARVRAKQTKQDKPKAKAQERMKAQADAAAKAAETPAQ